MSRSNTTKSTASTASTTFQSSFSHEKVVWDTEENLSLIEEFFEAISQQDGCTYCSKATCFYIRKLMAEKYTMKNKKGDVVPSMLFHITQDEPFPWLYFTNKASAQNQEHQKWRALPLSVVTGLRDKGVEVFKLPNYEKSSSELIEGIAEMHSKQ